MAERPRMFDGDLEGALRDLGSRVAYPPTPDLVAAVRTRTAALPAPERSRPALSSGRRWLALAAAALLVLAIGLLALGPDGRAALAERLGLRGVVIEHVPALPTTAPGPTIGPASPASLPSPPPAAPASGGGRLGLGQRLTLEQARARAPFTVLVPGAGLLDAPDEVYFGEPPLGGQVSFVYYARPGLPAAAETGVGLLLTQFRGDLDPRFYGKMLGPETRLDQLTLEGADALWLEGRPHAFLYRDRAGQPTDERVRLAGNVLLWERGELTLRLESALGRDEALRIAASVR